MTDNREGWGKDEAGGNAKKDSLAEEELVEFGTKAGEHHGDHEQKRERPNDNLENHDFQKRFDQGKITKRVLNRTIAPYRSATGPLIKAAENCANA